MFSFRLTLAALLALPLTAAYAQQKAAQLPPGLTYADYRWQDQRKRLSVTAAEEAQPAVILRDFTAREYAFVPNQQKPVMFTVDHRIVRVNSDQGIEEYNKIYLPLSEAGQVVQLRARTISPSGKVVEVDQNSMKELRDGDGGERNFKIFAVEGVEKGSEIEYVYARVHEAQFFGRERMQGSVPAHDVTFELISPRNITFEAHTYHGPDMKTDSTADGKHRLRLQLPDVAGLRNEPFAHAAAQRMRVEYKLAYAASNGRTRLFTWNDASQFVYGRVWKLDKNEVKAAQKIDKQLNVAKSLPVEEQIKAVEQGLKSSINVEEGGPTYLAQVVATRTASEMGMMRLMATLLKERGIQHDVVAVSDRSEAPLDADFDSWNYLDNFVLYFPDTKQYTAPGRPDYRYGMIPAEWTATKGLFISLVKLGSTESAVGKVRDIPALAASLSPHDMDIKVKFAPSLSSATVALKQVMGGYQAQSIQPYYALIPADKRTEIMQSIVKSAVPDATFKSLDVLNGEAGRNPLTAPFTVDATVESAALLDRAGPKYLFKVGTLIGPQSELYQQEERQLDVENAFNHRFNRTITFDIPEGYAVRNLNDLNINAQAGPEGKTYWFHSGYQQQGQTVTVNIEETYNEVYWPKKDFEAFRNVINAAANFNKVVLVLEKKS